MRKKIRLSILFALLFFIGVVTAAQEKLTIAVKSSQLNNGVVVVNIMKAGKSFQLQCNAGQSTCAKLKAGTYNMVELPKNFGLYECRNVEIYVSSDNATNGEKLGDYCLIENES